MLNAPAAPVLLAQLRFMSKWPWGALSRRLHHPSASSSTLQRRGMAQQNGMAMNATAAANQQVVHCAHPDAPGALCRLAPHLTTSTCQARPALEQFSAQSVFSPSLASSSTRGSKVQTYSSTAVGQPVGHGELSHCAASNQPHNGQSRGMHRLGATRPQGNARPSREAKESGICSEMSAAPAAWQAECHSRPPSTSRSNLEARAGGHFGEWQRWFGWAARCRADRLAHMTAA